MPTRIGLHRLLLACLLASALAAAAGLAGQEEEGGKKPAPGKVKLSKDEQEILALLNKARAKEELVPLRLNKVLCAVARKHTANMAKNEKMSHQLDGKRVKDRVVDAGYDYRLVGENLAEATGEAEAPAPKPAEIHDGWMKSKGHRENILNPRFREVGISMGRSPKGTYFYTQVFATPRE